MKRRKDGLREETSLRRSTQRSTRCALLHARRRMLTQTGKGEGTRGGTEKETGHKKIASCDSWVRCACSGGCACVYLLSATRRREGCASCQLFYINLLLDEETKTPHIHCRFIRGFLYGALTAGAAAAPPPPVVVAGPTTFASFAAGAAAAAPSPSEGKIAVA